MDDGTKRITGCFMVTLIVYAIASITLTCINFFHINSDSSSFVDISNNWQTGAIMDVTIATSCPPGYEEAFNYTWPGTESGCYCANISTASSLFYGYYGMYTSSCNITQRMAGCDTITPTNPVVMDVWGQENATNMRFCVQRSQETWLQVAQQSGPNCNNNTALKQCGFSPENAFCTSQTLCPINDVQIVNLTLPAQAGQLASCTILNNCTVMSQNSSSAKILQYKRGDTFDALPTAQMALDEYSMCQDSTDPDITPGRTDFRLLNDRRSTCYTEGASLWNWTDSMSESQLFSLNGLTNTINYLEPFGYYSDGEDGSDYVWSIFSRSYIPWNINCRGQMVQAVNNASTVHTLRNVQLALMIVTIIGGICLGIVVPGMLAMILQDKGPFWMRKWVRIINHVAKIPMLALQIAVIIMSGQAKGFFQQIITDNCSTPDVMQTLASLATHLQSNYLCNAINVSMLAVVVIVGFAYFHRRNNVFYSDSPIASVGLFQADQQPGEQPGAYQYSNGVVEQPQYQTGQFAQYTGNQYGGNNDLYAPPVVAPAGNNGYSGDMANRLA